MTAVVGTATPAAAPKSPALAVASTRRALPAPRVLGALKLPFSAADYDDDPAASSEFVVGPSTQLGATQLVSAVLAIPTDATEPTSEVYTAVRATSEAGPIVFHRVATAAELVTGAACETALAPPGVPTLIAGGLVDTGQLAASDAVNLVTDCRQARVTILTVSFPVPRELPPGKYYLCVGATTPDGYGAAPTCRRFEVLEVSALMSDIGVDGIALGDLRSGVASSAEGDFALGNAAATIVNAGNTAPTIAVRIQPFTLEEPAASPATVRGAYTVAVRAAPREGKPAAFESQAAFMADATPETRQFATVCLAPGETAALDFGVTPQGALASGSYGGALRVTAVGTAACPSRSVPDSMRVTVAKGPFAAGWVPSSWTWARDADGDGHGGRSLVGYGPVPPEGYVATADDCDDTRDRVYPGAPEIPDGLDNDCDGVADVVSRAAVSPTAVAPPPVAAPTAAPTLTPTSTPTSTSGAGSPGTPGAGTSGGGTSGGGTSGGGTSGGGTSGGAIASPTPSVTPSVTPTVEPTTTPTPPAASPTPSGTPPPGPAEGAPTPSATPAATPAPDASPAAGATGPAAPSPAPTASPP